MYIHTYIHAYIHTYVFTYIHAHVRAHTHTHIRMKLAGFLHVQSVDVAAAKLTVLAPNGLPMPSNVLLQGDIEYVE